MSHEQSAENDAHALRVFFDQDAICAEVICKAAADADCRLSCDEGCEEWGAISRDDDGIWHYVDDDGTGRWRDRGHRMHTVGYCNVCEFINDDGAAEFGSGTFDIATLPIKPQWEGGYYSWSPTRVIPPDTTEEST